MKSLTLIIAVFPLIIAVLTLGALVLFWNGVSSFSNEAANRKYCRTH